LTLPLRRSRRCRRAALALFRCPCCNTKLVTGSWLRSLFPPYHRDCRCGSPFLRRWLLRRCRDAYLTNGAFCLHVGLRTREPVMTVVPVSRLDYEHRLDAFSVCCAVDNGLLRYFRLLRSLPPPLFAVSCYCSILAPTVPFPPATAAAFAVLPDRIYGYRVRVRILLPRVRFSFSFLPCSARPVRSHGAGPRFNNRKRAAGVRRGPRLVSTRSGLTRIFILPAAICRPLCAPRCQLRYDLIGCRGSVLVYAVFRSFHRTLPHATCFRFSWFSFSTTVLFRFVQHPTADLPFAHIWFTSRRSFISGLCRLFLRRLIFATVHIHTARCVLNSRFYLLLCHRCLAPLPT